MKLEQEIKQTRPFKNDIEKLIVNIHVTSSWLNAAFAQILKPFDISPEQYNVLRILKGKFPEGHCNREITNRMVDKSSNATRIADKLLTKKLIVRNEHHADRRLVDIRITKKGLDLLNEINIAVVVLTNKFKSFNAEKARLMNDWLDELRK